MAVVITGANRGIGRGLRDAYAIEGNEVWGTTRGEVPEDEVEHWITLDMRNPDGFDHLAQRLDSVPVDLLVCNAGVYLDKGMKLADGFPSQVWADTFATNVTGIFLTIQSLLPNLQMATAPRVAIVSSQMGSSTRARGGSYIYRASKAAATNLARNLAADLEPLGIAVGAYHPGWVRTDMGGGSADIGLEQAVAGLIECFDALNLDGTGCFLAYDGTPLPY